MDLPEPPDAETLSTLLARTVLRLETEAAPMAGLIRVVALELEGGTRFPLPPGNALRSAGEVAEVRALLEGWPREHAAALRQRVGAGDPWTRRGDVEAALATFSEDPDALVPPGRWRTP